MKGRFFAKSFQDQFSCRFFGYVRCQHVVFYLRTDSSRQDRSCSGDHTVNDYRHMTGCSPQEQTCDPADIKAAYFCQDIYWICLVWFMYFNGVFDHLDLPVKTFCGKSCSSSCHLFNRKVQEHRSNGAAGGGISDAHLTCCHDLISLFFHHAGYLNPCFNRLNGLFSGHGRLFRYIFCSVGDFPVENAHICSYSHIYRENVTFYSPAHNTGSGFCLKETFSYKGSDLLSGLGHSFLYHTVVRAHRYQDSFIHMNSGIFCDPRDLYHHILQLSKAVKRMGDTVPVLSGLFHGLFI